MDPHLIEYIRRYINITEVETVLFQSYLTKRKVKRKEFLLTEGQICKSRYFIQKGCVRMYYIDQKWNEQIIHFGIDHWWITDYQSLINEVPSKMYIQATEDTEYLELPQFKFDKLCMELPQTERFFRKIMEKTFIAIQNRMEYMFSLSGEDIFNQFISSNPDFAQRVPLYMIASYLGMTPEFVSKVRARKK